jgi:hypothetical protein
MENWQLRVLAAAFWLAAVVCVVPVLALHSEWAAFRDGPRVRGTVIAAEARRHHTRLEVSFVDPHPYPGQRPSETLWTTAPIAVGATVDLVINARGHLPILAADLDSKRPSILVYVGGGLGAVVMLVLGVMVWRVASRAAARRRRRAGPLDLIADAALRSRDVNAIAAMLFGLFASMFALAAILVEDAGLGTRVGVGVLTLTTLWVAAIFGREAWRKRDPRRLIALITERPAAIAWCYVHEVRAKLGVRAYRLRICQADGAIEDLAMAKADCEPLMAELRQRAPHARFGFTDQLERAYKQAPAQWRPTAA